MEVSFLKTLGEIRDVLYDPIIVTPELIGHPNNVAHSVVTFKSESFEQFEPYIYVKLRDHAKHRKVDVNMELVTQIVRNYQENAVNQHENPLAIPEG